MAEQKIGRGLGIRRHIESLLAADACQWARSDIAHRVAASFTRGDSSRREPPHDRRSVFDVDEVKLEILSCSDMRDPVRILLSKFSKSLELTRIQPTKRNLDSLHSGRIPQRVRTLRTGGR